ncbi:MRG/MORF4L-binding protein [Anopheles maculipalpis]|uniref:MRG/MORF4L-binding protein n=1 Tax=Anopheles maculipalpis TaxID=1496333 RepID=UPI0021592097|nr:MRG/MORF4L-binding protein [Anopheles maculipalpis]XP_050080904.1 MRG/MORF4L-binding protein [Anopheles maculipalpis]
MTTVLRDKQEMEHSEWTPEEESHLFLAMEGVKPVGVNKHFYMACIVERLSKSLQRDIGSDAVWSHLGTLYNLKALDELEPLPFLNEECDFCLPEAEFSAAFAKRRLEDSERGTASTVPGEHDSKKVETKAEAAIAKTCPSRTPVPSARQEGKDGDKEDKDTKDRGGEVGSSKIKLKNYDNSGGHDSGPKRSQKRTRGSMSTEASLSNASSPANTPPNGPNTKRRRI